MGGNHGKSAARDTRRESSDSITMGGARALPEGAGLTAQTTPGTSICSRLGDWKSVRRTVNDLYQDGKHAFSFSPTDPQNYNNNASYSEDQNTFNRRNSDGQTPLTSLVHNKDVDAVRDLLLIPDVDVNYPEAQLYCGYRWDFYPPLIVAINRDDTDIVRLLLLSGASVNCKDSQGFTALYHASKLGNKDIVSLLLSHSPDLVAPPVVDSYTVTDPLQMACCHGHLDVVKLLIKAGEILEKRNQGRSFEVETVKYLAPLQHLCRLSIRNALKSSRNHSSSIVIGINKMTLPTRLKDYLCYSEILEMRSSYCDKLFCLSFSVNR